MKQKEIAFSCSDSDGSIQVAIYNEDLESPHATLKQFISCESIYGYSVLYSKNKPDYYVVSDVKCNGNEYSFVSLLSSIEEKEDQKTIKIQDKTEVKEENITYYVEEEKNTIVENTILSDIYNENILSDIYDENIKEEYKEEDSINSLYECFELEKCSQCDAISISQNLYIKCNHLKGYYPLIKNSQSINSYIECVNNISKLNNYYFDYKNLSYELCYDTCSTCNDKGDDNENNCISCEENFIKKPDYENSTNCVPQCFYYYFYTKYNQYKCTALPECPEDYNLLVKRKYKYIDNCLNHKIYKYRYIGMCYIKCPNNTKDNNNYIWKDIDRNKCLLSENEIYLLNGIKENKLKKLVEKYVKEFNYTNNHVFLYRINVYRIILYKNGVCISDLSL